MLPQNPLRDVGWWNADEGGWDSLEVWRKFGGNRPEKALLSESPDQSPLLGANHCDITLSYGLQGLRVNIHVLFS
jgi:hypothetical protein